MGPNGMKFIIDRTLNLRLHTHTQMLQYGLYFHYNSGYANALQCYVYTYVVCVSNIDMLVSMVTTWL